MTTLPVRREPPPFRTVQVARIDQRSPYLTSVTLTGPTLEGFDAGLPAASLRLLLGPDPTHVVLPTWDRNEFLLADGNRPTIRTLTPLRFDPGRSELVIEVVLHGEGPLSQWASTVEAGDLVAVSGTGRGYEFDTAARSFLFAGDESAIPGIQTLLKAAPLAAEVQVFIEARDLNARVELPDHPRATINWLELGTGSRSGDALLTAIEESQVDPRVRVWVAGEAAAMQRARTLFFDELELPRSQTVIRGYWKHDRQASARRTSAANL